MGVLLDKSVMFAVRIVKFAKFLEEKHHYILARQILKSGTSIGANLTEAKHAESEPDFIHKLSIAQKECSETLYWLTILHKSEIIDDSQHFSLNNDAAELIKMITASLNTLKKSKSNKLPNL